MSLNNPTNGEKWVWDSSAGKVYLAVKRSMVHGKIPRVMFHCYTGYAHWEVTRKFPLPVSFHPYEWTEQEVFADYTGTDDAPETG